MVQTSGKAPAPSVADKYTRERCGRCAGGGCISCGQRGWNLAHAYAEGRGEQGEDFTDVPERDDAPEGNGR